MNLTGKILVMLILVFSLVFMTIAMFTYAAHRNWRDVVLHPSEGLKPKLAAEKVVNQNLINERETTLKEFANERAAKQRSVALLEEKVQEVERARKQLQDKEAQLQSNTDEAVAAMEATQTTLAKLREEVEGLRTEIASTRQERDDKFKQVVSLEDQLAQAKGEWERFRKRNEELAADMAKAQAAIADAQIQLDRSGPPRAEGVILASRATGYVELSLGFDDGLEKGHELDVYRHGPTAAESKYLGRVRVVQTEADKSVAQILPDYKKGIIQKEDRVATRLR